MRPSLPGANASMTNEPGAVRSEISDEWETGKIYLNMKAQ